MAHGQVDDWTLVKALALLVWLAWGHLASSVASEAVAFARGRRARRIPGPSPLQVAATNLVASATLLFTGLARPSAAAAVDDLPELHAAVVDPRVPHLEVDGGPPAASNGAPNAVHSRRDVTPQESTTTGDKPGWIVRPRDTLWDIAERTLGDPLRWRDIHRLNVNRPQADGQTLQPDMNHVQPGWVLLLPADAALSEFPDKTRAAESGDDTSDSVTVEPGDTLWELADEHLDSAYHWPRLYQQNRGRVQPDGQRLTDPDLIRPGWRLDLPDAVAADGAAPPTTAPQHQIEEAPSAPVLRDSAPPPTPPQIAQPAPPAPAQGHIAATPSAVAEPLGTPSETGRPRKDPEQIQGDLWDEAFALAGFGIAAAGVAATLDRIRHSHRRRRESGQRIRLPEAPLAETELRIRGLADEETARLVDAALLTLISSCESAGQPALQIVLVSTSAEDVAVHLAEARVDPPEGWRSEDDGMTWVLPQGQQPAEPVAPPQRDATAMPLLVSIGTTAHGQRRVLLNLRHASLIGVDADRETRRTLLLGHAVELATTMAFGALRVVMVGFGEVLEALERIQLVEDAEEAVALL
ncbi:MAG: LysM peptidoglycan-binding domain-containing protein, partial [Actinomycetota bacterium]|nr:LysM peptidoglycan-binding domain-containing protein [Actinomycetota bacterium]